MLIRRPRQLELTPAGHALLEYCEEFNAADQRLNKGLSEHDDKRGEISLISPGSIGLALYPMLLNLQRKRPGITPCVMKPVATYAAATDRFHSPAASAGA